MAIAYFFAYCTDMECIAASENDREKMQGFVEFLIPIIKDYCSDKAAEICTIDIFGGYGYCRECAMGQYLRGYKIATIYEGTYYIQSLDLFGRKLGQNKGRDLINLFRENAGNIKKINSCDEQRPDAVRLEDTLAAVSNLTKLFA